MQFPRAGWRLHGVTRRCDPGCHFQVPFHGRPLGPPIPMGTTPKASTYPMGTPNAANRRPWLWELNTPGNPIRPALLYICKDELHRPLDIQNDGLFHMLEFTGRHFSRQTHAEGYRCQELLDFTPNFFVSLGVRTK